MFASVRIAETVLKWDCFALDINWYVYASDLLALELTSVVYSFEIFCVQNQTSNIKKTSDFFSCYILQS